ncbi:efflux RND transporter periplasmic adaptor subunit [Maribacter confluentis]|uniref:Efflux RND transporter periplasmic adaptor subunit n=1 Tax=Maribacter confluentis TaxID=1656093 RepID=A0ABT8RL07_9FLAO|nr:efflux RND transporter periplasmic adaptor subunit [Maribacter confluentis]MDO1511579.1 efflux RND transporter periplasmic adaptor subunit [Maribacter confluentis]
MRFFKIIALSLLIGGCQGYEDNILPKRTTLTMSVYASATIQPDSLYQLYAAVGGILDNNFKEEGDLVQKGDPILQIIDRAPQLQTENAYLALRQSKENLEGNAAVLKEIEDEVYAARLKYLNDSLNFSRQQRLWEQGIGSKAEYDTKMLAFQLSQNQHKTLKARYARTRFELETKMVQAKNSYQSNKITTDDFTVNSRIAGRVYALYKEPGELVSTVEPLGTIGSANDFIIEMLIDEVDIIKIQLNQQVLIVLEAYPNEIYTARVSKIYPQKEERLQTFKIEALFNEPPKLLYPGLAGEANIVIAQKKDVLTIPRDYLMDGNKVMTPKGDIDVEVGLQNLEQVEILSGITETTLIIKPTQ